MKKKIENKTRIITQFGIILVTIFFSLDIFAKTLVEGDVYHKTTKRWVTAVGNTETAGDSWVWDLEFADPRHSNKSRDSILFVPSTSTPGDLTLVVWFHGCGGFSSKTFEKRVLPQIKKVAQDRYSIAVAIPEMPWSINTSTKCSRQGKVWQNPGELENYVKDVILRLSAWSNDKHSVSLGNVRIVFVGHSAGGSAIASAAKEGGLCRLRPENIVWSDASYNGWLNKMWGGCVEQDTNVELTVLVRKWDTPWKRASAFFKGIKKSDKIQYKVLDSKKWTHTKIGNNVIELSDIFPPGC